MEHSWLLYRIITCILYHDKFDTRPENFIKTPYTFVKFQKLKASAQAVDAELQGPLEKFNTKLFH